MPTRLTSLLCGGALLLTASGASAAPIKAQFRAEGAKRTLVYQRTVTLTDTPVVKDGNPDHSCPGQSALGALQAATRGEWSGSWSDGLGWFVSAIKGERPRGNAFFELWIDHRRSSKGVCDAKLRGGEDVLMFVQDCKFNAKLGRCPKPITPLGIQAPKTLVSGRRGTIRVVAFSPAGKPTPQPGATVYSNGRRVGLTDRNGRIVVRGVRKGDVRVRAAMKGHVRSEVDTIRVRAA